MKTKKKTKIKSKKKKKKKMMMIIIIMIMKKNILYFQNLDVKFQKKIKMLIFLNTEEFLKNMNPIVFQPNYSHVQILIYMHIQKL